MITSVVFVPLSSQVDASIVRKLIYRPDPLPVAMDWGRVPPPERITVQTKDGLDLVGFRWPATAPDHVTLIFFHGNAGNAFDAGLMAAPLRRPNAEIIVASYRGYGGNPGRPSEAGLYLDGAAFLRFGLRSHPRHLYVFGFSLGGSVALHLAADPSVAGVVTLGTFSSLSAMVPRWARVFLPDHFDNLAAVQQFRAPYLLMHGDVDEVVPAVEASKLKMAARGQARLLIIEGAQHYLDLDNISPIIWDHIVQMTRDFPIIPERQKSTEPSASPPPPSIRQ